MFSDENPLIAVTKTEDRVVLDEARGGRGYSWKLVRGLVRRADSLGSSDQAALKRASPESGSFIVVSVRRRRKIGFVTKKVTTKFLIAG